MSTFPGGNKVLVSSRSRLSKADADLQASNAEEDTNLKSRCPGTSVQKVPHYQLNYYRKCVLKQVLIPTGFQQLEFDQW